MTDKEHALMMMMFTRQNMYIRMLINILKREEIIQGDDVPAFDSAVTNDPDSASEFHQVIAQYKSFASQLGMEVAAPGETLLDKT